jgi:uncharacterized membrane protein
LLEALIGSARVTFDAALHLFHVVAAAAGLVLGIVAMRAMKRRGIHTRVGAIYFLAVTAACWSAGWI